jgi:SpoVK/Ycf46/Vps4 family AAA+-type ATPase
VGGQLREVAIHPSVSSEALVQLAPWDYLLLNAKEMVVIGTFSDPTLFARAHGPVVEFKGYVLREHGLVRVARHGFDEQVVRLGPTLRDTPLTPGVKLVLQRDDEHLAIAAIDGRTTQSRFEVPVSSITTRPTDLAGMESLFEQLGEEVLLRIVDPELRDQFDQQPLRGMLLWSYKPGVGKTAFVRASAVWLQEIGDEHGFDVVLYQVKPGELKSMWHGGDGANARELFDHIRARQAVPRTRPLLQLVLFDEVDSLGKRAGGDDGHVMTSSAHNDAVQALLAEIDGFVQLQSLAGLPPAHVLFVGLTNLPDAVDGAVKRPERFGDLSLEIPDLTIEGAESVLAVYCRKASLPFYLDEQIRTGLAEEEIRDRFLRPALGQVFTLPILRYSLDNQRTIDVTAGQVLTGVHYKAAMNGAKKRAARRSLDRQGVPAIGVDDLIESLLDVARSAAAQLAADKQTFARQLRIKAPVLRLEAVPADELTARRFLKIRSA